MQKCSKNKNYEKAIDQFQEGTKLIMNFKFLASRSPKYFLDKKKSITKTEEPFISGESHGISLLILLENCSEQLKNLHF